MSIVESVLREEKERLANNIESYKQLLSSLPRGTIFISKVGSSSYVYRKRREQDKIISEYLGMLGSDEAKAQIKLSEDYKRIKSDLKLAKQEYKKLCKALKAYD